ncbi:MAG: TonB-dependent receptor [Myxococcales bacterium]|nr:TonB-dependent receptor [Myxococcales bacterium]
MRHPLRRTRALGAATIAAAGIVLSQSSAQAQLQFGQIQGSITNRETGQPLPGVTVVVNGPALQGDQTEVSDRLGRYVITQLPPGDGYVMRFYFNDVVVERPGIRITQNKTLSVNLAMPTQKGRGEKIVLRERAPNVDTATANTGVEINQEILQNTAVRGRTFESVISLAPGAADVAPRGVAGGDVGVSFSGSVGNENNVLIDGLNTTDLAFGLPSTQLHQYFIKEVNIISGGYQAEYGRATGGVISIVTKSGSNEFHGSLFGSVAPWQADATPIARLGEAIATSTRILRQFDMGFDLGGPIVRDHVWFYVGFTPTLTTNLTTRSIRTQQPEADPDYRDPSYLSDPGLSAVPRLQARRTTLVPERTRQILETRRLFNWIAKLNVNINPDHAFIVSYLGSPQFGNEYGSGSGYSTTGSTNPYSGDVDAQAITRAAQNHDGTLRYIGKFLNRKLQLDVLYGLHLVRLQEMPNAAGVQQVRYRAPSDDPYSLADFENIPECQRQRLPNGQLFNPCPVTDYTRAGFGQYTPLRKMERHSLQASITGYFSALGNHALKSGLDFEDNILDNTKKFTGSDFSSSDPYSGRISWETNATGDGLRINRGYALERPKNFYGQVGTPCAGQEGRWCFSDFRAQTETRNWGIFLRDSWNTSFLPGLVINAGLRWELQELFATDGSRRMFLWDNIAPRVSAAYDFSKSGRSKVYVNYGRFYQSVPMDLNDRIFSEEGFLRGRGFASDCPRRSLTNVPGNRPVPVPERTLSDPCSLIEPRLSGGEYGPVAPGLKGQFIDEVVAGVQYDIGWDVVLGAFYTYRWLGTVVEDLSVDGGNNYFIGNPGVAPDAGIVKQLEEEAASAAQAAMAKPTDPTLQQAATFARDRLNVYKAMVLFPTPKRDYHAVTITANKRLSNRFALLASYTYSRLTGNYPGPFSPYVNQLDPNISSQYDIIDLTANRDGPLNNDRPHNFKFTGFYVQPFPRIGSSLTVSLTFTAVSGRPIQVLGAHAAYGGRQTLILPPGAGGRTPPITQFDLHIGYEQRLGSQVRLSVFGDLVNLFNQQAVTNIDEEYTFSIVSPILYGQPSDLKRLKTDDGAPLIVNGNYGQPTAFQAPLLVRLGARLSF